MELITLKSSRELDAMRRAGRIAAQARELAGRLVAPGVTTLDIDTAVRKFIESQGAKPSFLGYGGFSGSACISVNDVVIHGIPSKKVVLKEGDIVSVDCGTLYKGYNGDSAYTFPVGEVDAHAVQKYVESFGYSVVRDFVGHGVGAKLHEAPEVPNYGPAGHGPRLQPGMTIAVEPMVCAGDWQVKVLKDGWTTVTVDGSLAAHYENTVLITDGEVEILTQCGEM